MESIIFEKSLGFISKVFAMIHGHRGIIKKGSDGYLYVIDNDISVC